VLSSISLNTGAAAPGFSLMDCVMSASPKQAALCRSFFFASRQLLAQSSIRDSPTWIFSHGSSAVGPAPAVDVSKPGAG
jgi:hypothetical protein